MSPRVSTALLVLLVGVVAVSVAGPSAAVATSTSPVAAQETATPTPVTENTTLSLALQQNGDARWRITDTYALENENETEAFEELAQAYVDGETETKWLETFRNARAAASSATGREMEITDVQRDYVVEDRRGVLVLEFTWTNFATVDGNRLVVDEAFDTADGTWLQSLTSDQTLVISPPRGYGVLSTGDSSPTAVEDGQLRFEGPRSFERGDLEVVYTGQQQTTVTTATPSTLFGDVPVWLGGAVLLLVGLAMAAGYMAREGRRDGGDVVGTAADDGDGAGGAAGAGVGGEDDIDPTLLSDEERVERLLERNGGRMKQARIVKETGWSNAKVSQLLSSMDEAGQIDKLRIGRENLISFPDEDITDFDE